MQRDATPVDAAAPKPTSRRSLLLGGAVGLAGLAADSLVSAQPASATQGSAVLLGQDNTGATAATELEESGGAYASLANPDDTVFANAGVIGHGKNTGVAGVASGIFGVGVTGIGTVAGVLATDGVVASGAPGGASGTGPGVVAQLINPANKSAAVKATTAGAGNALEATTTGAGSAISAAITDAKNLSDVISATTNGTGAGVFGSGEIGLRGAGRQYGIVGTAGVNAYGVYAQGGTAADAVPASGGGVFAVSGGGTAVYAMSDTGVALKVEGKVAFSRSGVAQVKARKTSVTVTLAGVTTSSIVLATLQTDTGAPIAVANVVAASRSFTITLTAAPRRLVEVGWFVIG